MPWLGVRPPPVCWNGLGFEEEKMAFQPLCVCRIHMHMPQTSFLWLGLLICSALAHRPLHAQSTLPSTTTYSAAYGKTKHSVSIDPARELPRYPAVEPAQAVNTWKIKGGFRIELAAHEPEVCDPIALCFDEQGRLFVCEMIDYSEMRDASPHMGRVRMLEDTDGDGRFEKATVFADNLPWPTGLIWANHGLYVGATPDIWRFEDADGDGRAERRERVFTGFGTGLKILNVQGLLNSFQWGQDNRIHVLAGGGNRGLIQSPVRPDLPGVELAGRDFWFDPLTHAFGMESGGAQYGMSFDNFGRKFGCSNADHLQHWVYDSESVPQRALATLPPARNSIAVDGGAAEVFRISPDEPWRIVRTRLRVAGAVPGGVEGGGRVSGYFTGATGTTIYRGDAFGADFVNNSFTGDAGGQLVHRKTLRHSADGVNLEGERPPDERQAEFAASHDTWVRVVNFANAPDGCLYILDMYREVIEHPWAIPDEIKKHLDLNSGNNRGRIYRLVPDSGAPRIGSRVTLENETAENLVKTLSHPNGWHRDTAHRLLIERKDSAAVPYLHKTLHGGAPLEKLHALGVLSGLQALTPTKLLDALQDRDPQVRIRALRLLGHGASEIPSKDTLTPVFTRLAADDSPAVRFQLALTLAHFLEKDPGFSDPLIPLAQRDGAHPWIGCATLAAPASVLQQKVFPQLAAEKEWSPGQTRYLARLLEICAASAQGSEKEALLAFVGSTGPKLEWVRALGEGFKKAGTTLEKSDLRGILAPWMESNARLALDGSTEPVQRTGAIRALAFASERIAIPAFNACLSSQQPVEIQSAAVEELLRKDSASWTDTVLSHCKELAPPVIQVVVRELLARKTGPKRLLTAVDAGQIAPTLLNPSEVQTLVKSKDANLATEARRVLAAVIPPSRETTLEGYREAVSLPGDGEKGRAIFLQRCMVCHVAAGQGFAVGPDLVTVKTRGREGLLSAIVDPNREVAAQYLQYMVETKDRETIAGIVTEDTAAGITLKMPGGVSRTVERVRVQGTTSSGQSLMPEGLEGGMTKQDMADLLTFIETLP